MLELLTSISKLKNLGLTMLSASTVITHSVSLLAAAALCAASLPLTPCTRLAHGNLLHKSA